MTALRIFIYTPFSEASRKHILQTLQLTTTCEVVFSADLAEADALPYMRHCHVLMGNPPVQWFTGDLNELRFWQLDSTGFDQYRQLNIGTAVANMGDLYSQPCAETIVSGILAYYRHLPQLLQAKEQKQWVGRAIRPQLDLLRSKVVLLLGAGHIAMAIKNILEGFGCLIRISASRNPVAHYHSKEAVMTDLSMFDLIINTLPGSANLYVDRSFLQSVKRGCVYASIGRGNTTDETALLEALETKHIEAAILDVTAQEPLPENHPFWALPNVVLTQHSGGGSRYEEESKMNLFLQNIKAFLSGSALTHAVTDFSRGY